MRLKKNKRIIILLMIFSFSISNLFAFSFYYNSLNSSNKKIYNEVYSALKNKQDSLTVDVFDFNLLSDIYFYVLSDNPSIFYVTEKLNYTSSLINDEIVSAQLEFNYKDMSDATIIYNNIKLNNILRDIERDVLGFSDFEIVKYVYDYLIQNSYYDKDFPDQSLLSILLDQIGLCTSYAKSFKFIMDYFNIDCFLVEGKFKGQTDSHVWNMIKLDNQWYHVDVTQGDSTNEYIDYSYLCVTDEQILKDHIILTSIDLPKANSDKYYYLKNIGGYFTFFDDQKVTETISNYIKKNNDIFILTFKDSKALNNAKSFLIDNQGYIKIYLKNGLEPSNINYFINDLTDTLIIVNDKTLESVDTIYFDNYSTSSLVKKLEEKYSDGKMSFLLLFESESDYRAAIDYLFEEREIFNVFEDLKSIDIIYYDEINRVDFTILN